MPKKKLGIKPRNQNPFTYLENDHREIERLFEKLKATVGARERDEFFPDLATRLILHGQIEKEVVYPLLKPIKETHQLTLTANEERKAITTLLEELSEVPDDTSGWMKLLETLHKKVAHHVDAEEKLLFTKARALLSQDEQTNLATQIDLYVIEKAGEAEFI